MEYCSCHYCNSEFPFCVELVTYLIRVLISDVVRCNAGDVRTVRILRTCYGCSFVRRCMVTVLKLQPLCVLFIFLVMTDIIATFLWRVTQI